MQCKICKKEAKVIVDGQSLCDDHWDSENKVEKEPESRSAGQVMSGM